LTADVRAKPTIMTDANTNIISLWGLATILFGNFYTSLSTTRIYLIKLLELYYRPTNGDRMSHFGGKFNQFYEYIQAASRLQKMIVST
ncbi:MAG: hypothetical protein C4292_04630, partial [Nitrososphaera sp.]